MSILWVWAYTFHLKNKYKNVVIWAVFKILLNLRLDILIKLFLKKRVYHPEWWKILPLIRYWKCFTCYSPSYSLWPPPWQGGRWGGRRCLQKPHRWWQRWWKWRQSWAPPSSFSLGYIPHGWSAPHWVTLEDGKDGHHSSHHPPLTTHHHTTHHSPSTTHQSQPLLYRELEIMQQQSHT